MQLRTIIFRVGVIGVVITAIAAISGCSSAPASSSAGSSGGADGMPAWYSDPQSVYPDDRYLSSIGSGDTRRAAEQDAAAGIAQVFESRISVDMRTAERYQELVSGSTTLSQSDVQFTQSVNIRSDQTLVNIQYGESATDNTGRVHVIGYLERIPTGNIYADLVKKNGTQVETFLSESHASGELLRQYAFLSAASVVAANNEVLKDQLRIISPGFAAMAETGYDYDAILQEMADLAGRMTVSVSVANDDGGRVAGALREALSKERFPVAADGMLSVAGSVRMEPIQLNPDYKSVRWYLNLEMRGPDGRSLVTYDNEERASGVTEEAATAFAFSDIEEAVEKDFVGAMRAYFDSLVLGK